MKKILISLSLLLLILPIMVWAAEESLQKIEIKKTAWGNQYYYMDMVLTQKQLEAQLKKVPATEPEIKKAKRLMIPAIIFSGAGGYLVGYQLGTATAGGEPKWDQAAYGVASVAIGVYCGKQSDKHFEKAVEIYNLYIEPTANPN